MDKSPKRPKSNNHSFLKVNSQKLPENYRSLTDGLPPLKREQRDLYDQAIQREGKVWKKSNNILVGYQKRFFKVIASGAYLAYYNQKPTFKQADQKPNGVFEISKLSNIKIKEPKYFIFDYNDRHFEMFTKLKEETDLWVASLKFLSEIKNREQETATTTRSTSYFHTLTNTLSLQVQPESNRDSGENDKKKGKRSKSKGKSHKFSNLDARAFVSVIQENPKIVVNKDKQQLSEKALQTKGIWNYLKSVKEKTLRSRIMYGFLKKRSKGKVKYFTSRWFFLISSRPLNQDDFLNDPEILNESALPPLLEFDVIYYFVMDTPDDASGPSGEIKTINILKVEIKNMSKSKTEEGHAFIIDTGKKLFHLNTAHRFELERWVEAIEISMQTSKERQLSLTGACKNISQIVTLFETNEDILRQQLEDEYDLMIPKTKYDWEDIESLLQICTELRDDMITTFDACLALKPPRKDIIELYMKVSHTHMSEVLSKFWEMRAVDLNPYETLSLVDWTYSYYRDLKKFGVCDDSVENGYLQLCNAFAKKTHTQIMPLIINILSSEREHLQIEEDRSGFLYTNAPYDMVKILSESFQIVVAKRIKDLILKSLKMFQNVTQQYQKALSKLLETDAKIQHDFMIAQCNNCFIFFELMEDLITPVRDICSDDEIESHYSQRQIQQYFTKIQQYLLNQMTNTIFKLRLDTLYNRNFLELDMEVILNESFRFFEDYGGKMSKSTSRQGWVFFLERTVLCYIQCMLNSSNKIRQKTSEEAIAKIKEDYEKIEGRFGEFMTQRTMKNGIEVLDDLVSFFESSPAFISVACEKMRKTHGPTFKINTVKAILNLRTDLKKDEKALAIKVCQEILDAFKNQAYDNQAPQRRGIFSNLDTSQAEAAERDRQDSTNFESLQVDNNAVHGNEGSGEDGDGAAFDLDDFLKAGGIDIEADMDKKESNLVEEEEKKEGYFNTDPDEKMCGNLVKSSIQLPGQGSNEDILGMVVNSIGNSLKMGFKLFTETIQIKKTKKYFAIKHGVLYWYSHERAREAQKQIGIKETKAVEINKLDPKEFYIVFKKKCYRLQCIHEGEALKWVNSLKMVKDMDNDFLDINRYEKLKIYSKVTGKSMYKDYDQLLEIYENKIHDVIEKKLQEYLQKKNKWNSVQTTINQAAKKEIQQKNTKAKNTGKKEEPEKNAFKLDDENFVKGLEETKDLMNKMNPNQIDIFQAAFGGGDEDSAYASHICKKLQQRAVKKALVKTVAVKEDSDSSNTLSRYKTEVESKSSRPSLLDNSKVDRNTLPSEDTKKKILEEDEEEEDSQLEEDGSEDSDWGLETNNSPIQKNQQRQQKKDIRKDSMSGFSLSKLDLDPKELISQQSIASQDQASTSCFACFGFGGRKKK